MPQPNPYADAYAQYHKMGWIPLPIPYGKKASPPPGYTGRDPLTPSYADLAAWADGPRHNIAVRMPEGVIGMDVDAYGDKPALATIAALEAKLGPLPDAPRSSARKGEGGIRFYRMPAGYDTADLRDFGPGVEVIRPEHRYAVVAPSLHPNTGRYTWVNMDHLPAVAGLPLLPEAWATHFTRRDQVMPSVGDPFAHLLRDTNWTLTAAVAARDNLIAELAAMEAESGRNNELNSVAMWCGHFGPEFWSQNDVWSALAVAMQENGYVDDESLWAMESTMRSGWEAGRADWKAVLAPERAAEALAAPVEGVERVPFAQRLMDAETLMAEPAPEWLIDGVLPRHGIGQIVGKSGSFKSFIALGICAEVARGGQWCERKALRGHVLYVVAEGKHGMRNRLRAWTGHHGQPLEGVTFAPWPLQIGKGEDWAELLAWAAQKRPALIVMDTQGRMTAGREENSNTEMGMVMAHLTRLSELSDGLVVTVHHTGHVEDRSRGASAQYAALDVELMVRRYGKTRRASVRQGKSKDGDDTGEWDIEMLEVDVADGEPMSAISLVAIPAIGELPPLVDPLHVAVIGAVERLGAMGQTASLRKLRAAIDARASDVDMAIEVLVIDGKLIEEAGPNRSRIFSVSPEEDSDA